MTRGIDPGAGDPAVLAQRLAAQLLIGPPAKPAQDVVGRLLAVQAQDPKGARLAVRARTSGLHASDVDRELTDQRSLILTTLNRGTLHLVRTEDYWWLQQLTTPQLATMNITRLRQEGVMAAKTERAMKVIEETIAQHGPSTRAQLRTHLLEAGVPIQGQALPHLFLASSLLGLTVRGPMVGGEQAFVLVREWLGTAPKAMDRNIALAELGRRFLAGHGPADHRDLARWAGITLSDARIAIAGVGPALRQRPDGLVDLGGDVPTVGPKPKLLGPFDPALFGWLDRSPILGDHTHLVTSNGLFRPFAMVRGRAVGTWQMPKGTVQLHLFSSLAPADEAALTKEAADVERFLR